MTIEDYAYEDLLWHFYEMRANGQQIVVPDEEALDHQGDFSSIQDAFLKGEWSPTLQTPSSAQPDPDLLQKMITRAEGGKPNA